MLKYPEHKVVVLWDGKSQTRRNLFPLYKANREAESKSPEQEARRAGYKKQVPKIMDALELLGVRQLLDYTEEADDLAGYIVEKIQAEEIVLITGDGDWKQLVCRPNVIWQDHRTDAICNYDNFEAVTGYKNAQAFLEGKALVGDTSDNIPGVGGIGKETAPMILKQHGSVETFLNFWTRKIGEGEKVPKWVSNFVHNLAPKESTKYGKMLPTQEAFARNMQLMKLAGYKPNKSNLLNKVGSYDRQAFRDLCQEFMFNSILAQFNSWIVPFERASKITESKK
jgi:5'-3' exonuclease